MMPEHVCRPKEMDSASMYGTIGKDSLACENFSGDENEISWKRVLLEELEQDIEKYDKIILVWEKGAAARRWLEAFYKSEAVKQTKKKILVLSVIDMPEKSKKQGKAEGFSCLDKSNGSFSHTFFPNLNFQTISEEKAAELSKLHHMYEFSDRFLSIPETDTYGGLFNFVDTGLLQMNEVWEALLH